MSESRACKVDHTIDRYDLAPPGEAFDAMDEYLVARWTGRAGGESVGYKQLTEWFNKRLLKRVYERRGRETLGTRLDSDYEALTGDDDLLRAEVADDLERDGIDASSLQQDMVSWSTLRRHLKECLDAEKPKPAATSEWEVDSVDIARDRLQNKAGQALRSLESKDRLPEATKADVDVQVKLSCPECPTRVPLEDALDRGYVCETHFEASEANERIQVSDSIGVLFPIGTSLPHLADIHALLYETFEFIGTDVSTAVLEFGSSLAL